MSDHPQSDRAMPSPEGASATPAGEGTARAQYQAHPLLRGLAWFLSGVFHPLLVPTFGFALFIYASRYQFANYDEARRGFELLKVFLLTAFFPGFTIGLMKALGFIRTVDLIRRDERVLPYVATGFFYIWAYVVYHRTYEPAVFQAMLLGSAIAVFAGLILNAVWDKVSMHTSGMGGAVASVMLMMPLVPVDLTPVFVLVLLAAGLVGTARLVLNAHTPQQVLAGYLVGYAATWVGFMIALS
jgi:membrane-associated phospholipid phosphatase